MIATEVYGSRGVERNACLELGRLRLIGGGRKGISQQWASKSDRESSKKTDRRRR